jgi:methylamine---glutamate N-methyltransferase subunit A
MGPRCRRSVPFHMCGIVGIFCKTPAIEQRLGELVGGMLVQMGDRGPDSAGVAIYRDPAEAGASKLSLYAPGAVDWAAVTEQAAAAFGVGRSTQVTPQHLLLEVFAAADAAQAWGDALDDVIVMSTGQKIEIFKEAVRPVEFVETFGIAGIAGSHAIGHTRMATESKVTTAGSHPFSTGLDLCLVHNGSLSNHNRLREELRREGVTFKTENDSEVAAGYLTWRLREGATLEQALEGCLDDLDGFYTFAVGTADGFAVLRDPIACKPAVMAETDDYVAIASEYRALAELPDAADATVWEPSPGVVYSWGAGVPA